MIGVLTVGAEQFRRQLSDLLNRVGYGGDEVIVERNGRPIAVLKPYERAHAAPERTQNDAEQVPILAAQLEAAREGAGIPYEQLARQLQAERVRRLREKQSDFIVELHRDAPFEPT